MSDEIECRLSVALPAGTAAPEWFMYLPGGTVKAVPAVNGKAAEIAVTTDEATVRALNRDLVAMRADGGPPPFFDFDHKGEARSALPLEFAWRDAPAAGVYVRVQWTPEGEAAVVRAAHQAAAYGFFSPRAAYDARAGRITGLLPRSRGLAAGGLVNDPAFETISPLTAARAAAQAANQTKPDDMNKPNLAALVTAGLLTTEEATQDNAIELAAAKATELKNKAAAPAADPAVAELTAAHAKLTAELAAMKGKAADKFVAELEASGKIPPRAEAMKKMWRANYLADDTAAEAAARELVATRALHPDALTDDADGPPAGAAKPAEAALVAAKAREIQAATGCGASEAWNQALTAVKTTA